MDNLNCNIRSTKSTRPAQDSDLRIAASKTEEQCIAIMKIEIGEAELKQVEHFTYLGSVMSQDAWCELDIKRRINLATGVAVALGTKLELEGNQQKDLSTLIPGFGVVCLIELVQL